MPIYDQPTRVLMHDFARETLKPNQIFRKQDAMEWFAKHYPKIKSNTVSMHVEGMSTNTPMHRRHHPTIRAGKGFDLFFKLGPNQYRLWDKDRDPPPQYGFNADDADVPEDDDERDDYTSNDQDSRKFAFERDLQNYLVRNLNQVEPGLRLYKDDDGEFTGVEYPAGSRRIDILALAEDGSFVVIETKVSKAYDRVIGQLLFYMSWVENNLADGAKVRGVIVASDISEDLKLATSRIPDVKLVEYEIAFSLAPIT